MEFSRQKYWSKLHFLLQGIFLTQGSNPHLLPPLQGTWILYHWATWEARCYTLARDKDNLIRKNVTPWFKMSLTHLFWSYWTVYHMIFILFIIVGFLVCFFLGGHNAGTYISDSCSNMGSPGNWNTAKKHFSCKSAPNLPHSEHIMIFLPTLLVTKSQSLNLFHSVLSISITTDITS